MIVTRKSTFSGKVHEMDLPITQEQIDQWHAGELIQHAMPHLTPEQREFLMTGVTPEEWEKLFGCSS